MVFAIHGRRPGVIVFPIAVDGVRARSLLYHRDSGSLLRPDRGREPGQRLGGAAAPGKRLGDEGRDGECARGAKDRAVVKHGLTPVGSVVDPDTRRVTRIVRWGGETRHPQLLQLTGTLKAASPIGGGMGAPKRRRRCRRCRGKHSPHARRPGLVRLGPAQQEARADRREPPAALPPCNG